VVDVGSGDDELDPDGVRVGDGYRDGLVDAGCADDVSFDPVEVVLDEGADGESLADASPGWAATAPTPSATAKAPTRPMYRA